MPPQRPADRKVRRARGVLLRFVRVDRAHGLQLEADRSVTTILLPEEY